MRKRFDYAEKKEVTLCKECNEMPLKIIKEVLPKEEQNDRTIRKED